MYSFTSGTHVGGSNQAIIIALYKKSLEYHEAWIRNKKQSDKLPKIKMLSNRFHQDR